MLRSDAIKSLAPIWGLHILCDMPLMGERSRAQNTEQSEHEGRNAQARARLSGSTTDTWSKWKIGLQPRSPKVRAPTSRRLDVADFGSLVRLLV